MGSSIWLVAVLLASVIVYHLFEKPVSDLREKFTTRVTAAPFGLKHSV